MAFFGRFDKPVPPDEYTVIVSMKYGKRSLTSKGKVKLTEEDIASISKKPAGGAAFELKPSNIEIKSPPGGIRSAFFNITNTTEMPIKVTLSLKDIEYSADGEANIKEKGSTPYSSSDWIELEKTEYVIGPGLSQTVSIRIKVPESAQPGSRYSQVVVEKSEGEAGHIEKISLKLV